MAIDQSADAVIGVRRAPSHPMLAKRLLSDGSLEDFVPGPRAAYVRRQDLEPAFTVNGAIYVNRRKSLLEGRSFVPAGARAYVMPPERSVDIDGAFDLEIARYLVASNAAHD